MRLITEVNENVEVIKEDHAAVPGLKHYYITGIFLQANIKNRNGRVYPVSILENEVNRYVNNYVNQRRAFGELGHPSGPMINLDRASHLIEQLYKDGDNFIGKAKILDTPNGKIVKSLLDEDAKIGVSSRGMGSLKTVGGIDHVGEDFYLATAADIVADPSAPDAFVRGIMEGKEWVWDNGILKESVVSQMHTEVKKVVDKPVRKSVNERELVKIFTKFLNGLSKSDNI